MQYSVHMLTKIIVVSTHFSSIASLFRQFRESTFSIFRNIPCCSAWRLGIVFAAMFSFETSAANITPYGRDGVTQVIFIAATIMPGDMRTFANIALTTDRANWLPCGVCGGAGRHRNKPLR
jgi:hypothetical protein